jgi:translation initiation factor IF-1
MSNDRKRVIGIVEEALPDLKFRITLEDGRSIMAYTAGKLKFHKIKIIIGDRVMVELDPYGGKATNRVVIRL